MNADVKNKWIAALESGKYSQGRAALCKQDGEDKRYCCLGVLCDLAVEAGVIPPPEQLMIDYAYGASRATAYLPREVAEWAGVVGDDEENQLGDYNVSIGGSTATRLNDNQGFTFKEIAALLRKVQS